MARRRPDEERTGGEGGSVRRERAAGLDLHGVLRAPKPVETSWRKYRVSLRGYRPSELELTNSLLASAYGDQATGTAVSSFAFQSRRREEDQPR